MLGVVRIFFRAKGTNPRTVLGCLLVAGLVEGIGIATLLPLLSVAIQADIANDSLINQAVLKSLNYVGLSPELNILLWIVVAALIIKACITFVAMVLVGYATAHVSTGIRTDVVKNLLKARWSYFTAQPVGRFANSMSNDATRAGRTYEMAAEFLANSIQTGVFMLVALIMSWRLTLLAVIVGGIILLILNSLVRVARRAGQKQTDRTKHLIIYLTDVVNNVRPLKAMAREGVFSALLDRKIELLRKALRTQVLSLQTLKALQEILIALAMGVGVILALEFGNIETSELLVMGLIVLKVLKNMASVQRQYQKVVLLESPYYALEELIEETSQARENPHGGLVPELMDGCRLQEVRFAYGGNKVLEGIDLEIPCGEITVLTGVSGTGKTTVTDLLLGFHEPDSGEVLVDGVSLSRIDLARWRRMIGYVPQEPTLLHDTILNNITLGDPNMSAEDVSRALQTAGALGFVMALPEGVETRVGEKGSQISGGQRQRLALARALAARPKLLILDEVTSALDNRTEEELCATLREISGTITILAVSHRPGLMGIADNLYKLADGRANKILATPVLAVGQDG